MGGFKLTFFDCYLYIWECLQLQTVLPNIVIFTVWTCKQWDLFLLTNKLITFLVSNSGIFHHANLHLHWLYYRRVPFQTPCISHYGKNCFCMGITDRIGNISTVSFGSFIISQFQKILTCYLLLSVSKLWIFEKFLVVSFHIIWRDLAHFFTFRKSWCTWFLKII